MCDDIKGEELDEEAGSTEHCCGDDGYCSNVELEYVRLFLADGGG